MVTGSLDSNESAFVADTSSDEAHYVATDVADIRVECSNVTEENVGLSVFAYDEHAVYSNRTGEYATVCLFVGDESVCGTPRMADDRGCVSTEIESGPRAPYPEEVLPCFSSEQGVVVTSLVDEPVTLKLKSKIKEFCH